MGGLVKKPKAPQPAPVVQQLPAPAPPEKTQSTLKIRESERDRRSTRQSLRIKRTPNKSGTSSSGVNLPRSE